MIAAMNRRQFITLLGGAVAAFVVPHAIDPHEFESEIRAALISQLAHAPLKSEPNRRSWLGTKRVDTKHLLRLLRARRQRPRSRTAEQRHELAPLHSITSSARASSVGGISMPSAFAALRLMTSSYFVGACTGRSAGFAPLRMRST